MSQDTLKNASKSFDATVIICDIRGFSHLSIQSDPNLVFRYVNQFIASLATAVLEEEGVVNNLTGDGFLAYFISVENRDSHALRAVNCSIKMRQCLKKFNQQAYTGSNPTINIGVGVNSGEVAIGKVKVGTFEQELLIGSTVNVAARIESITKKLSVDILVSEETRSRVKNLFELLPMGDVQVEGKDEHFNAFWVTPQSKIKRIVKKDEEIR